MNTGLLHEISEHLPPRLLTLLVAEIGKLEDRCDELQAEVNSLENPPHQLCGHAPGRCKC